MARQKKEEPFAVKVLVALLVGCVAQAVQFGYEWVDTEKLPSGDLFMLKALGIITFVYIAGYSLLVMLFSPVCPWRRYYYRRLKETLPHRKPR